MYSQQGLGLGSPADAATNGIDDVDPNHESAVNSNVDVSDIANGDTNGTPDTEFGDSSSPGPAAVANAKGPNRYMKGRLPEGVDFAAYPGRSSTPLPTAESKSAERINQLKIWNEAATNDDKRRLPAGIGKNPALGIVGAPTRRTDSYKEAKDRHSASFHGAPPPGQNATAADMELHNHLQSTQRPIRTGAGTTVLPSKRDMFADRSDSDDEDDDEVDENQHENTNRGRVNGNETAQNIVSERAPVADQVQPMLENDYTSDIQADRITTIQPQSAVPPVSQTPQIHGDGQQMAETTFRQQPSDPSSPSTQPPQPSKQSKGCCTIM